jgi:hypothetical protein
LAPATTIAKSSIASTAFIQTPVKVNTVPVIDKQLLHTIDNSLPLYQRIGLVRELGKPSNVQSQNVQASSGFELSFSYCMVTLQRPWMLPQVFNLSNIWYSLSEKAGFYSNGELSNTNKGVMRALPKAMIAIKDLTIRASQWSDDDKRAAASAIGFGAFNVTGSTFTSNTLSAPGIQIIGWVCEVLPKLPLNDDTNIIVR